MCCSIRVDLQIAFASCFMQMQNNALRRSRLRCWLVVVISWQSFFDRLRWMLVLKWTRSGVLPMMCMFS